MFRRSSEVSEAQRRSGELAGRPDAQSRQSSLDMTRDQVERSRPTAEQLAEIRAVRSQVHPWLQYYLQSDTDLMKKPGARSMLIKINEEFDKEVRAHPRQHISLSVRNSISDARDYIESNTDMSVRRREINVEAIDVIESRIKDIWSGKELKKQEAQLAKVNSDIEAFVYVLEHWNATARGNSEARTKMEGLESQKASLEKGIERLSKVKKIPPPTEPPSYSLVDNELPLYEAGQDPSA